MMRQSGNNVLSWRGESENTAAITQNHPFSGENEKNITFEVDDTRYNDITRGDSEMDDREEDVDEVSEDELEREEADLTQHSDSASTKKRKRRKHTFASPKRRKDTRTRHRIDNRVRVDTRARHRLDVRVRTPDNRVRDPERHHNDYSFRAISQYWDYDNPCNRCGKIYLSSVQQRSRILCCGLLSQFPQLHLKPLPPRLRNYGVNRINHLSRQSAFYNSILSIASTGVDNGTGGGYEQRRGDSAVTLRGRTYHFLNRSSSKGAINYFTHDAINSLETHIEGLNRNVAHERLRVIPEILTDLFNEQKAINVYVHELRTAGELLTQLKGRSVPEVRAQINTAIHTLDVAGITSDASSGQMVFRYRIRGMHSDQHNHVNSVSPLVEPLCYPLLFPHGERGWSTDIKPNDFMKYLSNRLTMPEPDLFVPNKAGTRLLNVNRFQLFARLAQYYVVESVSRAIDYRLKWHRNNQATIFGQLQNPEVVDDPMTVDRVVEDSDTRDPERVINDNSSPSFLAGSFTGSPRHLKLLARNSLTIVSEHGPPTFFITATCNKAWPEIDEMLLEGQTIFDRPDIADQVFKQRLEALVHNLKHGKYFGGSKIVYMMRVIEYQHRGLPHAHIIVRLENHPSGDYGDRVQYIDKHVCARYSAVVDSWTDAERTEHVQYQQLISNTMTHRCSTGVNGCKDKNGICSRGYMTNTVCARSRIDNKGYAVYCRPTDNDLHVVPHNPQILLDWGGHINVEFCGTSYTVLYLYKYLFKGNKKLIANIREDNPDIDPKDEINLYIRGRVLCSMDAVWRVFGFQTYPASFPTCIEIKVKLPFQLLSIESEQKLCDLSVYFARPQLPMFEGMLFTTFCKEWLYSYTMPQRYRGLVANVGSLYLITRFVRSPLYLFRRQKPQDYIVRMAPYFIGAGEIWYLRTLMQHFAAYSYDNLCTVQDVTYPTFQAAAVAAGIIEHPKYAEIAFKDAVVYSTPHELRMLFVNMTMQGFATLRIYNSDELREYMFSDLLIQFQGNRLLANNELLKLFALRLKEENKTLEEYGFPGYEDLDTELAYERLLYDQQQQQIQFQDLCAATPNTAEMEILFELLAHDLNENNDTIYLLQGEAGCGKSTFAKKFMAYARGQGNIVLGCASTGLAASIYENFYTAHSLFKIPVIAEAEEFDQEQDLQCKLFEHPQRLELLEAARVIVWDEIGSQHQRDFSAVYSAMNSFKGKIVLLMGDNKQIAPVVERGTRQQVIEASIYCSKYFRQFNIYRFTRNMRLIGASLEQQEYSKLILAIGSGNTSSPGTDLLSVLDDTNYDTGSTIIGLRTDQHFEDVLNEIHFLYPDGFDPAYVRSACVLASVNTLVDVWNSRIQELNANQPHVLKSMDVFDEVDDPHDHLAGTITEEILNKYSDSQAPPHELILKVNDVCILMRNVDRKNGLTNNCRVEIVVITERVIRIKSLNSPPDNPYFANLPRFRFKVKLPYGKSFSMCRTQFPLRLAYSMTMNRSQGQEFTRVLVDLTKPVFSHGHLYVAMSRIRRASNIAFMTTKDRVLWEYIATENVVYNEILDPLVGDGN